MPFNTLFCRSSEPQAQIVRKANWPRSAAFLLGLGLHALAGDAEPVLGNPMDWPPATRTTRPAAYWWWLGSAVDATNLTRELVRYRAAGMGGVHVIPIYGAKGWETNYLEYLSPQWLAMFRHAVAEADRLDINVDLTTGTGWCFGGPHVTDLEANATVVVRQFDLAAGTGLTTNLEPRSIQALVAFDSDQTAHDLLGRLDTDGRLAWNAPQGGARVYAVSQKPSGQRVKRAAPGGAGHMLNLLYPPGVSNYLTTFEAAFRTRSVPGPRAMYHDSYEYRSDWAPDFFDRFERRRGYRLQTALDALFGTNATERTARVKSDYRETVSDVLIEDSLPLWTAWCRSRGLLTRNQAHGSPGNLLDLYALADIPETEMFHTDRNRLVSKFAASAAHVAGRRLVAAETGTWLKEHFTETLGDMKLLLDDLFLAGVNHVFYHGSCYSPDAAGWPGWLFYASFEMNPRNPVWRDVDALNACVSRCQSILQSGHPDEGVLLYWPIHDRWHNPAGLGQSFSVHARDWLEGQPVGHLAERLWNRGYAFDYVSDRQLELAAVDRGDIRLPGGAYHALLIPTCTRIPVDTFARLIELADAGATVLFEQALPVDVPGWGHYPERRARFDALRARAQSSPPTRRGRIAVGDAERLIESAGVARESLVDHPGLMFVRRRFPGGRHYFLANRGERPVDGWVALACNARSVVVFDPLTGERGLARSRPKPNGASEVDLQLPPGGSLLLRVFADREVDGPSWPVWTPSGAPTPLEATWHVEFLEGGPELPSPFTTARLASWTELGGEAAQRFAGTARYRVRFPAQTPVAGTEAWSLDLGRVAQSARVRLNGRVLGTLLCNPFRIVATGLGTQENLLEIEVTSVAANRIRDLDRRKIPWRNFHDINFVNTAYKPFDASSWPLTDAGLLGPVTLTPLRRR